MGVNVLLGDKLMFPSDYISAVEFKGKDVTLTISGVAIEELKLQGGKKDRKPVFTFKETPKKYVCNKTNAKTIAKLYGSQAKDWIGKRVTFFPSSCECGGETVDCIRVRAKVPSAKAQAEATTTASEQQRDAPARTPEPEPSSDGDSFAADMARMMGGDKP